MSLPFLSSTPVETALRGFAAAHPNLVAVHEDPLFATSVRRCTRRQVGLVSGGGSGHEPLHAGFLGVGMLDAAVPGAVFASPHNTQIHAASRAVAGPGGVLHIVKNYTGDVINFAIAAERLSAEGVEVATVLVDDDVATGGDDTETGRRGTGATVVVEKILGAAADAGLSLDELAALGADVAEHSRSVAVAARAQTDFHTGEDTFELDPGHLEYGVGIHGERAAASIERPGFEALVAKMVDEVLAQVPGDGSLLLFVNGLGATTQLELLNVYAAATDRLSGAGETVDARLVGNYVAALDMTGFSITLTRLRPEWLPYWEASSITPSFPASLADSGAAPETLVRRSVPDAAPAAATAESTGGPADRARPRLQDDVVRRFAELVEEHYEELTRLDRVSGDGDFGDNLRGGLREALQLMNHGQPGLAAAERAFLDGVGGTSGPLLGLLFKWLDRAHRDHDADGAAAWARGTAEGCAAIQRVGGAQPGDRTIVDVLHPAAEALRSGFAEGARTAADAARATADLEARRGRASYVAGRGAGEPDAGATGVALLFRAAADVHA
ncbi:dihydroxyacetone kinase subunit DhaK [Zhihengliuella halotolerans]|uniref:dihydroxyacetone kinase subunit DhaK n=1 Tax=Zhihengliuella halotolerans TaxID=370736 RepID=UPI000C80623A|nr:dihydroxyacetone kinase subunit DhaK [Zhihengliuella halotolerans]